jgi:hypothetical protein
VTAGELRAAYYCCAEVMRNRKRVGQPIPQWLRRHFDSLHHQILMSQSGDENGCGAEESDPMDLITALQAATVLGCSKRHVIRLAADLDSQLIGGRWLFNPNTVTAYAEGRQHA